MQNLNSPCEIAVILACIQKRLNPPPNKPKEWILDNIARSKKTENSETMALVLSTTLPKWFDKIGEKVDKEEIDRMTKLSNLPIRQVKIAKVDGLEQEGKTMRVKIKTRSSIRSTEKRWSSNKRLTLKHRLKRGKK